jgi:putative ubiquitin-RnfH superfamily antitoxin RatB of RatAB toxin-antitoxin module
MPSWCARKRSTVRRPSVIRIEIVYAQPQRYVARSLSMAQGAVIADALGLIAADPEFSGIDLAGSALGIFGKVAQRDQPLKDGDRIEIYRPLAEEPKLARRNRASKSGRS